MKSLLIKQLVLLAERWRGDARVLGSWRGEGGEHAIRQLRETYPTELLNLIRDHHVEPASVKDMERAESLLVAMDVLLANGDEELANQVRAIAENLGEKTVIDLSDWQGPMLFLIAKPGTGVVFTNQTGGTTCYHPTVEGYAIPLPVFAGDTDDDSLGDFWAPEIADIHVQSWLEEHGIDDWFDPWIGHNGGEAWIPVRIKQDLTYPSYLVGHRGECGFLTYENSD